MNWWIFRAKRENRKRCALVLFSFLNIILLLFQLRLNANQTGRRNWFCLCICVWSVSCMMFSVLFCYVCVVCASNRIRARKRWWYLLHLLLFIVVQSFQYIFFFEKWKVCSKTRRFTILYSANFWNGHIILLFRR